MEPNGKGDRPDISSSSIFGYEYQSLIRSMARTWREQRTSNKKAHMFLDGNSFRDLEIAPRPSISMHFFLESAGVNWKIVFRTDICHAFIHIYNSVYKNVKMTETPISRLSTRALTAISRWNPCIAHFPDLETTFGEEKHRCPNFHSRFLANLPNKKATDNGVENLRSR